MVVEPYYRDELVTLYCGDSRELFDVVPDNCILLTDPFYGINGGRGGDSRDFKKAKYITNGWEDTEDAVVTVCVPVIEYILTKAIAGAVTPGIRCLMYYPKPRDIGCFWTPAAVTHGPWGFSTMQPILYYGKDHRAGKGALPSGKQVTERSEKNGHPCPKPIGAWTWLMDKVSRPSDIIIDPFAGSGTTLVAARNLGRKVIGIEIEEVYCEIAIKRLGEGSSAQKVDGDGGAKSSV